MWGAVGHLGELMHLRKEYQLPDEHLAHLTLDDWRLGARILARLEELQLAERMEQ